MVGQICVGCELEWIVSCAELEVLADPWCLQERIRAARNPSGGFKW